MGANGSHIFIRHKLSYFLRSEQCDQMLEQKVAQIFQQMDKNTQSRFYLRRDRFQSSPKVSKYLGNISTNILSPFLSKQHNAVTLELRSVSISLFTFQKTYFHTNETKFANHRQMNVSSRDVIYSFSGKNSCKQSTRPLISIFKMEMVIKHSMIIIIYIIYWPLGGVLDVMGGDSRQ